MTRKFRTRTKTTRFLEPSDFRTISTLISQGRSQAEVAWETGISLSSIRFFVAKVGGVKRIRSRRQGAL
jgi:hypothetical protein